MGRSDTQKSSKVNRGMRDAEATKQQILDAAELEFAKNGLSGARTEAIATRAGVAPRMIYYYFQSKEGLYQAVLQRPATEFQQKAGMKCLRSAVRPILHYRIISCLQSHTGFAENFQSHLG